VRARERASLNAKVVIASVQTLKGARLARFPRDHFDLVIADEADLAMAPSWHAILDHFDGAKILGVTATPIRADGQPLGEIFESVAYRYEIRDAIRDG
jgi:superfamily II DNA or RNA helicase